MIKYYILPIVTIPDQVHGELRVAKYIHELGVDRGMMDYGLIDAALVAADVTQVQHESLIANIDVVSPPSDLDQNVSDIAIPKIQAVLEQLRIPAGWVDNTFTYREIMRMVAGLFQFAQRYYTMHREALIDNVAQLDLRWNQIPQVRRDQILATADDLGYEYNEVENTWLIRRIFRYLGDQWGERSFNLGVGVL